MTNATDPDQFNRLLEAARSSPDELEDTCAIYASPETIELLLHLLPDSFRAVAISKREFEIVHDES